MGVSECCFVAGLTLFGVAALRWRVRPSARSSLAHQFDSISIHPEEDMATNLIQIKNDSEIKERLAAERARLRKIAARTAD